MITYSYINMQSNCKQGLFYRVPEMIHITCNMGSCELADVMYALSPWALAYISGKSLLSMLQLLHLQCYQCVHLIKATNYKLLVSRPGETMKSMRAGDYYSYYLEYYCTMQH